MGTKNKLISALLLLAFIPSSLYAAVASDDTARMVRTITPPLDIIEEKVQPKDQWYADGFYEPSDILQGNRTGHWNEIDTTFGYIHQNIHGYFTVSQFERFDIKDYTATFGSYITLKDSYFHDEIGFGWDVDYIYKFQALAEYGHKIYKGLYAQMGYNYRAYETGDTHMIYPSLIYYFGDSYISGTYGVVPIEGRDTSDFATFRGDFYVTDFLRWYCGVAFGERLYDIYGLDAGQEYGYILFAGLNLKIYKGINVRAGYSYGTERPKFIKRSINFAATAKF